MVLLRAVEPGQTVAASLQTPVLFKIAGDLRKMEIVLAIDEADIGQVREGQPARFTVDCFPGSQFRRPRQAGAPGRDQHFQRDHLSGGGRGG